LEPKSETEVVVQFSTITLPLAAAIRNARSFHDAPEDLLGSSAMEKPGDQSPTAATSPAPSRVFEDSEADTLEIAPADQLGGPLGAANGTRPLTFEERYTVGVELARGAVGRVSIGSDRALGREIAIKELIRVTSEHAVARFVRESLMTARLQHPSIIPVYDVGRRGSGEPYLVMRLVNGKPLSELIEDAPQLSMRLRLLPPVLAAIDALAYAHEKQIIHRDLKPSNILVGEFGETVVIDWGLAKDLRAPEAATAAARDSEPLIDDSGTLTLHGSILGTPTHMAPEQARGKPADKRSDVYALGAVLYQLLAGALPFDGKTSREVLLKVTRGEPVPLEKREPSLPADLITIVRKAMSLDPALRFPSARELAGELRRFQSGQLVAAHRYSLAELGKRWIRKYRLALAVGAAAIIVLAALGAVSVRRVIQERDRANHEAEAARRVAGFLSGMFKVSDPSQARGSSVSAREVLDRASKQIDEGLAKDPAVQSDLMAVMGDVYTDLGLYPQAEELLRKALATSIRLNGDTDPRTLSKRTALAILLYQQGRYPEAEKLMRALVAEKARTLGEDHKDTIGAKGNLANLLDDTGHYDEAQALMDDGYARRVRLFGKDDPETIQAEGNLVSIYMHQGQDELAIKQARQTLADSERVLGADHPQTIELSSGLSSLLIDKPDSYPEAQALLMKTIAAQRRVLGPEHPNTLATLGALANLELLQGKLDAAEKLYRQTRETAIRVEGRDQQDVLRMEGDLANVLGLEHKVEEAVALYQDLLERQLRVLGPDHPTTIGIWFNFAELNQREGRLAEAEKAAQTAADGYLRIHGADNAQTGAARVHLGLLQLQRGELDAGFANLGAAAEHGAPAEALLKLLRDPRLTALSKDARVHALSEKVAARLRQLELAREPGAGARVTKP
jgi:tetratricopeptide (TPR) repeat protein